MPPLRALVIALLLAPSLALARPATDEARAQAKQLLGQGASLYQQGSYADALAKFQAAYDLFPSQKILFNIAEAQLKLDHRVQAANAFNRFLSLTQDAPDIASQRAEAKQALSGLVPKLAMVTITVSPPEAEVSVDGEKAALLSVYVAPGTHQVQASAPGFQSSTKSVTVASDDNRPLVFALEKTPPPAPDKLVEPAPAPKPQPEPALEQPAPSSGPTAGWVLAGVGGAALVTSAVFGALAGTNNGKLHDQVLAGKSDLSDADVANLRSTVRTQAWVSTATLGAGLVSAGIGAFLLVRGDPPPVVPGSAGGSPAVGFNF